MDITILAVGTRGDVQPYVALGIGLQASGHTVTIATSARYHTFVTEHGLRHAALAADFLQMMETPEGKAAIAGKNLFKLIQRVRPMMRQLLDEGWQASQGADAIIYHPKALSGYHIAEKLDIPGILAHPVPLFAPTREFPSPALPVANLGGMLNKASYWLVFKAMMGPFGGLINEWRKDVLGLPPVKNPFVNDSRPIPQLYAYSPHIIPTPSDWDSSVTVTGYWFLDHSPSWQPSPDLMRFLEAGPPPVYVGFGSMTAINAAKTSSIVLDALRQAGVRAVLATGIGGLQVNGEHENVFLVKEAPHDWLFPRMAAIVHHGGAGTTGAGFRAGKPQMICPFFGDQPFWGRRVAALGVGPQPIAQKRLKVEPLAQVIHTITSNTDMQTRAAKLARLIQNEDGVARAVAKINARLGYTSAMQQEAGFAVETRL